MPLDLQALINATAAGGTLNLQSGQTYGPGKVSRRININGNGAGITGPGNTLEFAPGSNSSTLRNATVYGPTAANAACILVRAPDITIEDVTAQDSLQYGIRSYQTDRLTIRRATIKRVATGIQVHRNGADNLFEDITVEQIDRMRVDDGSLGTNGGQGLDFYFTTGTTKVNRLSVFGARAKTKGGVSWAYDGSAVEGYGPCAPVIIDGFTFGDCVNVCEVGTNPGAGVPTGWMFRNGEAHGNPDPHPGPDRSCQGFYLRANNGFVIENNSFTDLDDFALNLVQGGNYGGPMGGNSFRNNEVYPKAGRSGSSYTHNRVYVIGNGVTPTTWGEVSGNLVYSDAELNPEIGYRTGTGGTRDVAQFRTMTGWSLANEVWHGSELETALNNLAECRTSLAAANQEIDRLTSVIEAVHQLTES